MTRRGVSLIELMIGAAIVMILGILASSQLRRQRLVGIAEVQRAEALIVLEYAGDAAARGTPADPAVVARLTEELPEAALTAERGARTVTYTVTWRDALGGHPTRSLTVFAR